MGLDLMDSKERDAATNKLSRQAGSLFPSTSGLFPLFNTSISMLNIPQPLVPLFTYLKGKHT